MEIWESKIQSDLLTPSEEKYLNFLPNNIPDIQWIWNEMDRIWDECNLDNKQPLINQDVGSFYGHPIWMVNGLFTENDEASVEHRKAIAKYLKKNNLSLIGDFGGGSGMLAKHISLIYLNSKIDIIEPYPYKVFEEKVKHHSNIKFVKKFSHSEYDCIIAQDVLEHVDNPIELSYEMSKHLRVGGRVIFANCFYPFIKCHLPSTFYLRHTFKFIMKRMGLSYIGCVPGAEHALVFEKNKRLDFKKAKKFALKCRTYGKVINYFFEIPSKVKKLIK